MKHITTLMKGLPKSELPKWQSMVRSGADAENWYAEDDQVPTLQLVSTSEAERACKEAQAEIKPGGWGGTAVEVAFVFETVFALHVGCVRKLSLGLEFLGLEGLYLEWESPAYGRCGRFAWPVICRKQSSRSPPQCC